jgi:2-polyprenyl-3-methyl-5-hydroxy-6-metoxy-1,4-benzoquinol methylase
MEQAGLLHPAGHVLDLGCGTGQLSLPLIARGYRVTGVDSADAMLNQYRSKLNAIDGVSWFERICAPADPQPQRRFGRVL